MYARVLEKKQPKFGLMIAKHFPVQQITRKSQQHKYKDEKSDERNIKINGKLPTKLVENTWKRWK